MTSHIEWLAGYEKLADPIQVRLGDNRILMAVGKGFIETHLGIIDPVYYLPELREKLFATTFSAIYHKIFSLHTDRGIVFLKDDKEIFSAQLNAYNMNELKFRVKLAQYVAFVAASLSNWHDRLGHVSVNVIKRMADKGIVNGLVISELPKSTCEPCVLGKQHRVSHPTRSIPRGAHSGAILHFDTVGPMPEESLGGAKFYVLCKDSFSGYRHAFFVQTKCQIPDRVKEIINLTTIQTGHDVKQIHTDNGSEYLNSTLSVFLGQKGIVHTTSAVYTAEQNGFIERDIRTVAEMARAMRIRADLPKTFWAEAIGTAVYNLNRVVNSSNRDSTPFELWFGRKPSLANLHRFGEAAIVYQESRYRDKLDAKGEKLTFVGYTDTHNTFRFIDRATGRLTISCNAVFLNTCPELPAPQPKEQEDDSRDVVTIVHDICSSDLSSKTIRSSGPTVSTSHTDHNRRAEDELPQTFSGTDLDGADQRTHDEFGDDQFVQPSLDQQGTMIEEMRPTVVCDREAPAQMPPEHPDLNRLTTLRQRTSKPTYTGWKINLSASSEDNPPRSAAEARRRPDWPRWHGAMQDEYDSLVKNQVFELVPLPSDRKVKLMSCRWVFVKKKDGRYKARLVARGFEQIRGVHYFETYAPTPNMEDIRFFLAYAAANNLLIAQFDIKTAFLYEIDVDIFMSPPEAFEQDGDRVWRLRKSLYGLKQSPRQWSHKFTSFLLEIGLDTSSENHCVFSRREPLVIVVVYVDDGIIFARRQSDIDKIMTQLKSRFEVHIMDVSTFLGFQIVRPRSHQIILHQAEYVGKVLQTFGATDFRACHTSNSR